MKLSPELEALIEDQARKSGVPAARLRRFIQIESGGRAGLKTGSYHGLVQLSEAEYRKHGGKGNIYDPASNIAAGATKLSAEANEFTRKYGRAPTDAELYLVHQQGWGGYDRHTKNPNAPAWQNMAATAEGRQRGPKWAREAIWGNIPDADKKRFGSVDNITSADFSNLWTQKVGSPTMGTQAVAAGPMPAPAPSTSPVEAPPAPVDLAAAMRAPDPASPQGAAQGSLMAIAKAMRGAEPPKFQPIHMTGNIGQQSVTPGAFVPTGTFRA